MATRYGKYEYWFRCALPNALAAMAMITVAACGSASQPTAPGSGTVTAAVITSVAVTGAPVTASSPFQLTATARLSDGSTQDVTSSATWESSNTQVAIISTSGYVSVLADGDVDLRAIYGNVAGAAHTHVNLSKTYTLSGVVSEIAPNAHPIGGARVQILVSAQTFTGNDGAFSISGVPAGRALLEVSKDGYEIVEANVIVDSNMQLTFYLYPTPPNDAGGVRASARCNDGSWTWAQTPASACAANGGVAYAVCPGPFCTP